MRLAKYLAQAGIASRRQAEQLISTGKITVNGQLVSNLATIVEPGVDQVAYMGRPVSNNSQLIYLLLYKPAGFICSVYDPQGRPTVLDLLKDIEARIYPVGRLDLDTSGLLLLSNDGAFTNLMIHPRYKIVKKYEAWVKGQVREQELIPLRSGIQLEDGLTAPAEVRLLQQDEKNSLVEIAIHEGRKRQVKRMCIATGHPVLSLKRTGLAFLSLRDLKEGQYRHLSLQEIEALKQCAGNESNDHDG